MVESSHPRPFARLARRVSLPFRLAGLAFLMAGMTAEVRAEGPPASFSRTISTGADSVTVNFTHHPIRSANFQLFVQDATGTLTPQAADDERTYLGTATGRPGALASGLLRADGTLLCRISFENGIEWSSTGGTASIRGTADWTPAWPTTTVGAGGAGSVVRAAEVGVDATYREYVACGSNVNATVEMAEFSVMSANVLYLRDAAILHQLGQVVVRTDATADPYEPDGGDTGVLLPHIRTLWGTGAPYGTTHDLALVARPGAGGGLAYVGVIGTSSRYSADGTDSNGDFTIIWRHEAGHNWGSSHYEGGGKPEGPTVMSDNSLSRFSSSELAKIIAHRNTKTSILDNLGPYSFSLPPRANMDRAAFLNASAVPIDVLANDSDSNGDAITLLSFPAQSAGGGSLARSVGTGPGGRDEILYNPPPGVSEGTDSFSYQIADATGRTATGYVVTQPLSNAFSPVDHWKLDEESGSTATNSIRSLNGTHQNGAVVGQGGANTVTKHGVYYDGVNDRTSIAAPNYNTVTLSFTAWIKRDGVQNPWSPVIFTRAGSSVAGFGLGDANELRYHWNDAGYDFNPSPSLTVPDGQWCLVSMAVSPTGVTLHLRTPSGLQSATNTVPITSEAFNGLMYLARDTSAATRFFKGWIDDVRVYPQTLTAAQIESLYQQAEHPPEIAVVAPVEGASISPLDVDMTAEISSGGYLLEGIDFIDSGSSLGTVNDEPFTLTVPALNPGSHTVLARATYGDWGYAIDSAPVTFTALPPPLPVVIAGTRGIPSRSGPIAADFVITRSHPIGALTVPFTISGNAVSGTDYDPLPTSVTFPAGSLSQTVTLTPVAGPPQAAKTVTLTLSGTADFVTGSPAAATLTIDDHITSIIDGAWNLGTTWTNGVAAPVTGTQNSGDDYTVAHVVTSNNSGSNSQALICHSLRIVSGGTLDLARLHATTNQNVAYNLPTTTIEDGGTIQFRASVGSSTHSIAAAIKNSGSGTLRINGGAYSNNVNLTGAISGNGVLQVLSDSNGGSVTADVRQLSVNSANNSFTGDWTVNHTGGGDEFASLRAGAARALGSGTVTVGTRARLTNDSATGLDSLAGIVVNGVSSRVQLNQPWNNSAASLALSGGSPELKLGNATSSIGNLSGTTGIISGSGSSSQITVNQTTDTTFGGALGTLLKFTKAGPATLQLAGEIDPTLQLGLNAGKLGFGGKVATLAALTQSGGDLLLDLGSTSAARLTISGNYTRSGGGIIVKAETVPLTGVAYPLVAYQGTLANPPSVSFDGPVGHGLVATVQPGSGTNSVMTVTFSTADPFPAWAAGFGLTGNNALPTADPDGDGVANREEMLLGFDPTSANSRLVLTLVSLSESEATLSLNRVVTTGTFTLESSGTLEGPWTGTPIPISADGNDHPIQIPRIGDRRFHRVIYQAP